MQNFVELDTSPIYMNILFFFYYEKETVVQLLQDWVFRRFSHQKFRNSTDLFNAWNNFLSFVYFVEVWKKKPLTYAKNTSRTECFISSIKKWLDDKLTSNILIT